MQPCSRSSVFEILRDEARLEDEVLRRITGDGQFRSEDQFGAGIGEAFVGAEDLFEVPANRRRWD